MRNSTCKCVYCGDCKGSGQISVPSDGYPKWDLESCSNCHGTGIAEMCSDCIFKEELCDAIEKEEKLKDEAKHTPAEVPNSTPQATR